MTLKGTAFKSDELQRNHVQFQFCQRHPKQELDNLIDAEED